MDDPETVVHRQLLKVLISGLGNIATTAIARMMAGRKAKPKELQGGASTENPAIRINTQLETVERLLAQGASVDGELAFDEEGLLTQSLRFQAARRLSNIEEIVSGTADELEGEQVPDSEPDHEFTARFFNEAQDVSSKELKVLWGKVLAGEIKRPGSTSIKTLSVLKNMDRPVADTFALFCSACLYMGIGQDGRVPTLGGRAGSNILEPYGFNFRTLNLLHEHGLIVSDYESWTDMQSAIGIPLGDAQRGIRIPFRFQGQYWVLPRVRHSAALGQEFRLNGVALTSSGLELSGVVQMQPMENYKAALVKYFETQHLRMVAVDAPDPQSFY